VTEAFEHMEKTAYHDPEWRRHGIFKFDVSNHVAASRYTLLHCENEDLKASVVERFNGTRITKTYRYFTDANTRRYVDVLDDLVRSYNHTYHRSIGMVPVEVEPHNEDEVRARLYSAKPKSYKWRYAPGDRVRIVMQRRPFCNCYLGDWSQEIFEIVSRLPTTPVTYEKIWVVNL